MLFYTLCKKSLNIIPTIWCNIKYEGLENIPKSGAYIIVSNHRTNFDPSLIGAKISRQIFFMAKKELFKNKLLAVILKNLGTFPVERGSKDDDAMRQALNILSKGEILFMFPEGTRSKTGELLKFKSGASLIALESKVNILPAVIKYSGKLKFQKKVIIRYGELIKIDSLNITENRVKNIKMITSTILKQITELLEL